MAAKIDPIWQYWTEDNGATYEVGDLGIDLDRPATTVAVVSNENDARLLAYILKFVDARLP